MLKKKTLIIVKQSHLQKGKSQIKAKKKLNNILVSWILFHSKMTPNKQRIGNIYFSKSKASIKLLSTQKVMRKEAVKVVTKMT